ncbi:EAL domain-containing protein [Dongshaea marina]|uniref:EAL domain-containing protein n=1 Tax=Dongshaea marina TaxID=2047966 RepID=UPI000D3EBB1A|nr:EAL domain-containing protein [Dongshaea marina]
MNSFSGLNRFISSCVIAAMVMMLLGAGVSLWLISVDHQQRLFSSISQIVDEQLTQESSPDAFAHAMNPLMDASSLISVDIYKNQQPFFKFQNPGQQAANYYLHRVSFQLPEHPEYKIVIYAQWPLDDLHLSLLNISGLLGAALLVLLGLWGSLRRLKYHLDGAERLMLRAKLISRGELYRLQHTRDQEWPPVISQVIDDLQSKLEDANKERSRFDAFMRSNAFVDSRSGIGNRIFFDNRLEAAVSDRASLSGAILLIEIAPFEEILSREGEEAAEQCFNDCSSLVSQFARKYPQALVARYDEHIIAMLIPHLSEVAVDSVGLKLYKSLSQLELPDFVSRDHCFYIGIVCFQYGESATQVENEAEMALRGASLQVDGGWYLYEKGLEGQTSDKGTVRWRTLLSRVLSTKQVTLLLQPVVGKDGKTIIQRELFGRIPDEDGRMLSAGVFMPMAENVGLHVEFDRLMITQMLELMKSSQDQVPLSVNLNASSLLQRGFHRWLSMELLQLPKQRLQQIIFEVSEHQISQYFETLKTPMLALHKLGCKLCVDHAGQDVVSTQYIKEFSIDYLKLHTSLVRNIEERQVNQMAVRSLLGGAGRSTQVLAVGVETHQEWSTLVYLGIRGGRVSTLLGLSLTCPKNIGKSRDCGSQVHGVHYIFPGLWLKLNLRVPIDYLSLGLD